MLVRLLGEEQLALEKNYPHPFSDVPPWANAYVGYLFEKGLTRGVSENTFGSRDLMTSEQYVTFILRAIGYDDSNGDFVWNASLGKAEEIGMLSYEEKNQLNSKNNFLRDDMVGISFNALNTNIKESDLNLAGKLLQKML